jgi:tRNA-splicing ligase RtcB (3'-phosphate/5'-hydroxy nucleic acid ligase)
VFGQADDRTLNQIRVCARTADRVALMPDNHVGYGVPIGDVVAYKNAISTTGNGSCTGKRTQYVNASVVDEAYRLIHEPKVVEIEI